MPPEYGINLDPRHGIPVSTFTDATYPWVRSVLKPDDDVAAIRQFITEVHNLGGKVLAVIARESYPTRADGSMRWTNYTAARWYSSRYYDIVDMWQLGNEPDITSDSSWTMTPEQYVMMLATWRRFVSTNWIVGPGLASGNSTWWNQVPYVTRSSLQATCLHMYQQRPTANYPTPNWGNGSLQDLLSLFPNQRIWITEFGAHVPNDFSFEHNRAEYISKYKEALANENVETAMWFCAQDSMVPGYGLLDANGLAKESYAAYYN